MRLISLFSVFLSLVSFIACCSASSNAKSSSKIMKSNNIDERGMLKVSSGLSESTEKVKIGVLFLNLGGPQTLQDVEGFLYNLFADPDIIRLPNLLSFLQKPIAYYIARNRAPKSSLAYASIGGGSPIVRYTQAQADLIEAALRSRGEELSDAKCYFAMRYWYPFTEEVLSRIQEDGVNRLVIVPLYPQYSISTSGSSLKLLEEIFKRKPSVWGPDKVKHTVVPSWYQRPGYIRAMARLVLSELRSFSQEEMQEGLHVLFSAHGVPQSYIAAGDPYQKQIEECVRLVAKDVGHLLRTSPNMYLTKDGKRIPERTAKMLAGQLSDSSNSPEALYSTAVGREGGADQIQQVQYHLSFQSRVGPVQWLRPYTDDTLAALGKQQGVRNLVVVPVSFVSEHIETLEEIDMEYRELALDSGVKQWRRVPALNTDDLFIKDMADLVIEALHAPPVSLSEVSSGDPRFLARQKGDRATPTLVSSNSGKSGDTGGKGVFQTLISNKISVMCAVTLGGCVIAYNYLSPLSVPTV